MSYGILRTLSGTHLPAGTLEELRMLLAERDALVEAKAVQPLVIMKGGAVVVPVHLAKEEFVHNLVQEAGRLRAQVFSLADDNQMLRDKNGALLEEARGRNASIELLETRLRKAHDDLASMTGDRDTINRLYDEQREATANAQRLAQSRLRDYNEAREQVDSLFRELGQERQKNASLTRKLENLQHQNDVSADRLKRLNESLAQASRDYSARRRKIKAAGITERDRFDDMLDALITRVSELTDANQALRLQSSNAGGLYREIVEGAIKLLDERTSTSNQKGVLLRLEDLIQQIAVQNTENLDFLRQRDEALMNLSEERRVSGNIGAALWDLRGAVYTALESMGFGRPIEAQLPELIKTKVPELVEQCADLIKRLENFEQCQQDLRDAHADLEAEKKRRKSGATISPEAFRHLSTAIRSTNWSVQAEELNKASKELFGG